MKPRNSFFRHKSFSQVFLLWTLLLVLAVGCTASPTTVPSGPVPAPAAQDVVPLPSPEPAIVSPPVVTSPVVNEQPPVATPAPETTPAQKPVPQEIKDTAAQFIWTVDQGIRIEDASVPGIHRLEDGRYRIYYGGSGGILSAISQDGLTFTKETGVRVSSGGPGGPETIASDPTVVRLKDGRVRLYYKGATGPGGPGQSVHSVFSAISTDGLHFEKEGIRIDSQQTTDRGWASVPEAIVLPDGRVRLYYVSDALDVKHGIVSAISDDGFSFTREGPVLTGFVDPAVVRLANGSYLMLAVAFPFSQGTRLTDAAPGIYSFISKDGIKFEERQLAASGQENIDPTIADVGGGAYRVYYWNARDNPPVIKSATGRLK